MEKTRHMDFMPCGRVERTSRFALDEKDGKDYSILADGGHADGELF